MKPITLLLAAIVLALSSATAQSDSGLLAHWTFEGNAHDVTYKGHGAALPLNAPYFAADINGNPNSAIIMNASTLPTYYGLLSPTIQPDMDSITRYTVCATFKPEKIAYNPPTIPYEEQTLFQFYSSWISAKNFSLYYTNKAYTSADTNYTMTCRPGYTFVAGSSYGSNTPVASNVWHTVVWVVDSLTATVYVDGVLHSQRAIYGVPPYNPFSITIGGGGWDNFRGLIGDMRFYRRALSSAEAVLYHTNATDTLASFSYPFTDTGICSGGTYSIPYTTQKPFLPGNIFSLQLSDANGSFAAPVVVGTATATTGGNITANIPATIPTGSNYRLRIVSSAPYRVSTDNRRPIKIGAVTPAKPTLTGQSTLCQGDTAMFIAASNPAGITYRWGKNGSTLLGITNSFIAWYNAKPADGGLFTVQAVLDGCSSDTTGVFLTVNEVKPFTAYLSQNTVCLDDSVNVSAIFTPSFPLTPATYSWTNTLGAQYMNTYFGKMKIDSSFLGDKTIYVAATLQNGCVAKDTLMLDSIEIPTPVYGVIKAQPPYLNLSGQKVTFSADSVTGKNVYYQWMKNGVDIPGADEATYVSNITTPLQSFQCRFSDNSPCVKPAVFMSQTITMDFQSNSGVAGHDNNTNTNRVQLYPNPNNGTFTLLGNYPLNTELHVSIINTLGQEVYSTDVITRTANARIQIEPTHKLASGIYTVRVSHSAGINTLTMSVE